MSIHLFIENVMLAKKSPTNMCVICGTVSMMLLVEDGVSEYALVNDYEYDRAECLT